MGNGPILIVIMLLVYKGIITLDEAYKCSDVMQKVADELNVKPVGAGYNLHDIFNENFLNLFTKYMKEEN